MNKFFDNIFSGRLDFDSTALALFEWQLKSNPVYNAWVNYLHYVKPGQLNQLPFMPVAFFKTHDVTTGEFEPGQVFTSSGTTGASTSRHLVNI